MSAPAPDPSTAAARAAAQVGRSAFLAFVGIKLLLG